MTPKEKKKKKSTKKQPKTLLYEWGILYDKEEQMYCASQLTHRGEKLSMNGLEKKVVILIQLELEKEDERKLKDITYSLDPCILNLNAGDDPKNVAQFYRDLGYKVKYVWQRVPEERRQTKELWED